MGLPGAMARGSVAFARAGAGEAWAVARAAAVYGRAIGDLRESAAPWPATTGFATPVALVHGAGHDASAWCAWRHRLRAAGFERLVALEYWPGIHPVEELAADLGRRLEAVRRRAGSDRVHVVGHSLGGLALRVWHDLLGGDAVTGAAVTLGSPHQGLPWAMLPWVLPAIRQLAPGSRLYRRLAAARAGHDSWTTIGGDRDRLVPAQYAGIAGPPDVVLRHLGHMGLLYSRTVAGHVSFALLAAEESSQPAA